MAALSLTDGEIETAAFAAYPQRHWGYINLLAAPNSGIALVVARTPTPSANTNPMEASAGTALAPARALGRHLVW